MARLIVDNIEIEAQEGANLLEACLENGIFIPNLCYIKGMDRPHASCRLCFVEIEGEQRPLTSCTVSVKNGMRVYTNTPSVRKLQWSAFELLMSNHRIDCANCISRRECSLIKISRFLKIRLKPISIDSIIGDFQSEDHPCLIYDASRCIRCGKCTYICMKRHNRLYLTFSGRGINTNISFYGTGNDSMLPCRDCLACVDICPVSALISYRKYEDVKR